MRKNWYAITVGKEDTDHGTGSYNKRDAMRMAKQYAKKNPDKQIAIVTVDPDDDFCRDAEIIQEGE